MTQYIYFLYREDKIVYIGSTKNIKSRIKGHKESYRVFDRYTFEEYNEHVDIKALEDSHIKFHDPEYNRRLNKKGSYMRLENALKHVPENRLAEFITEMVKAGVDPIFANNYKLSDMKRVFKNMEIDLEAF